MRGGDWHLPYFTAAVEEVLGPYLGANAFIPTVDSPGQVTYRRDDVAVSFSYWMEDLPSPSVAIGVGLVAPDGSHALMGLWRALEDDAYSRWRFNDETTLKEVLVRIVDEVLKVHGPRVWGSKDLLASLHAAQVEEAEAQHLADRRRVDLLQARRAFEERRFQDAVDTFVLLGPESLSAGDRRRLYQARKLLRADEPEVAG